MNNPEYIIVDVFAEIVAATKAALNLPVLNYQYGYVKELNETLAQWNQEPAKFDKRFPLVWLAQPFTINHTGSPNYFGTVTDLSIYIIHTTDPNLKAAERMNGNFKLVIYPIYRELLHQVDQHEAISYGMYEHRLKHRFIDRYYWGEAQQQVLNDYVDCSEMSNITFEINHNRNCKPFKNF